MITPGAALQRINLSDQVVTILRERINKGEYQPKETLPSITDLAVELGVGRSTIREALTQLESLGLVDIRHGKGIYVAEPSVETSSQLKSFSETILELGMQPSAQVLKREKVQAEAPIAGKLHLEPGQCVNYLVRLRLADGLPMAIESSYTPCTIFPDLLEKDGLGGSLYEILKTHYQKEVTYATRTIKAVLTRSEENKLLGLSGRQPALKIETIALDENHHPIEYGTSLYRADRYHFIVIQSRNR